MLEVMAKTYSMTAVGIDVSRAGFCLSRSVGISAIENTAVPTPNTTSCQIMLELARCDFDAGAHSCRQVYRLHVVAFE